MTGALVVLVLVVAHDGGDGATPSIERAMTDALRGRAEVVVRTVDHLPSDDQALEEAHDAGAGVVAEVDWIGERQAQATVHVYVAGSTAWLDRRIGFSASDAPAERGRTVGFTVASVMPEPTVGAEPSAPPPAITPSSSASGAAELRPSTPSTPAPPPPAERDPLGAVDLSLVGALGSAANNAGVELGLERRWRSVAARVAFEWRTGDITAAQLRTLVLSFAPGIAWRPIEPSDARSIGLGFRAAYVVIREQLTRPVDGASPPAQWQSGAQALVEGSWRFAPGALFVLAVGGEAAFGSLDVVVGGRTATSIAPLRALAEGGIRVRF